MMFSFFKQKTAYDMLISDWSSDVCSSDLKQSPILSCPVCGSPSIIFKSAGTKAIVAEVQQIFPEARIIRFDTDNLKAESLEERRVGKECVSTCRSRWPPNQ